MPNVKSIFSCSHATFIIDSQIFAITGLSSATDVFTLTPESLTVAEGTTVTFTCSTPHRKIALQWIGGPGNKSVTTFMDENGQRRTLSFVATKERNNTVITCQAGGIVNNTANGVFAKKFAYLFVQGNIFELNFNRAIYHIN